MLQDKRERVLAAARETFLRFGFRRVGMNDLAEAAGISRPGLYLLFGSKEDVFKGVYRDWVDRTIAEVEQGATSYKTVPERLRFAFELWAVRAFEAARQSVEASELIGCTLGFAAGEVKASDEKFARCVVSIVEASSKAHGGRKRPSPRRAARVLVAAVHGLKQTARDVTDLRRMIDDLLTMYLG